MVSNNIPDIPELPEAPEIAPIPEWQQTLERAGFVRQLWRSRRWYGADWWFVALSAALLLTFVFIALFPQLIAPYDPQAEVGPAFLGPPHAPVDIVIVARSADNVRSLLDLAGANDGVGIIAGSQASTALRDREAELNAGRATPIRPEITRYDTPDELLTALSKGEIKAAI